MNLTTRRPLIALLMLTGLAAAMQAPALAQTFPSRTVTIVVPFPPGGGPDLFARMLAEKLAPRLGQAVIVENKPGAGALMGAGVVAKANPDGHTLLLTPNTMAISPHVLPKGAAGGIDVQKDLTPILAPGTTPMALVANPQLGVSNLAELTALARKTPGLPYGSAGNGSPMHFAGEMFKRSAGVDLTHVPYRGVGPSLVGALGGEVKLLYVGLGGALQHIKSGKLVVLAVTEKKRSALLPQSPTATEQGVANVEVNAWYGLFAPAGTPAAVISRINQEVNQMLLAPDLREKMLLTGLEPLGGSAQVLETFLREDSQRYAQIARELNIKAD
jgi:tripartite-type tricarboxylate transporter receptor subunit TctC